MEIRRHAGSLDDSIATTKEIPNTMAAIRAYALEQAKYLSYTEEELASFAVEPYGGPDERIGWDATFIITYVSHNTGNRGVFGFCDQAPEEGIYVKLLNLDGPTRGGNFYPSALMAEAVEKFNAKNRGEFFGETRTPDISIEGLGLAPDTPYKDRADAQIRRVAVVAGDEMAIRGANLRIEDGFVVATVKPAGVAANVVEMLQNAGKVHFAMRAFVSYEFQLPMDQGPRVVDSCDIVTFDLCDKPL
jgi:hypothetical protein